MYVAPSYLDLDIVGAGRQNAQRWIGVCAVLCSVVLLWVWHGRDLPDPPQPVQPIPSTRAIWHWDGMPASGNGDNAVWVGSTSAGLRLCVKGDDPLWQVHGRSPQCSH